MSRTSLKDDILGGIILTIFAFGWMDTLWIFGVENHGSFSKFVLGICPVISNFSRILK